MCDGPPLVPAQETRGGDKVDWAAARPGQPLPELPAADYPEPDSTAQPADGDGAPFAAMEDADDSEPEA